MKEIKAAKVNVGSNERLWKAAEGFVATYSQESNDCYIIDTQWLQETEAEGEDDEARALCTALDSEPSCEGWRGLDLLYLWP